jgi:hypothetical protein
MRSLLLHKQSWHLRKALTSTQWSCFSEVQRALNAKLRISLQGVPRTLLSSGYAGWKYDSRSPRGSAEREKPQAFPPGSRFAGVFDGRTIHYDKSITKLNRKP